MSKRYKLEATSDDLNHLHGANNSARAGSKMIKIERARLFRVLTDYAKLLDIHKGKVDDNE